MISGFIRSFLNCRAGYNVYQLRTITNKGRVIDLIGPPAVGKSTLIAHLSQRDIIKKRKTCIGYNSIESLCHSLILKSEVLKVCDLNLLKSKLHKLQCDALLNRTSHETGSSFLVDEGISHQFTQSMLTLYDLNRDEFNKLMHNRAIILIEADPNVVIRQYMSRRLGRRVSWYENKTEDELHLFIEEVMAKRRELLTKASKSGSPTLSINYANRIEDLVERVEIFLNSL